MRLRHPAVLTALSLLALWVLVVCAIAIFASTAGGTRAIVQLVQKLAPELYLERVDGTLTRGLHIGQLRYGAGDTRVSLEETTLSVHWSALLHGELKVQPLTARQLTIELTKSDAAAGPVQLPLLVAPLRLKVPELALQKFQIASGDSVFELLDLHSAATWSGTRLRLRKTHVQWQQVQLDATGTLDFRGDYALRIAGQLRTPELAEPIAIATSGNLRKLELAVDVGAPYAAHADIALATLDADLPLSATLQLAANTVLVPQLPLTARAGTLQLRGDLKRIDGTLQLDLDEPYYGASTVAATLQWQPDQLQAQATLTLPDGSLQTDCALQLAEAPSWNCTAAAEAIPLTPWLPGIEGTLSGPIALDGSWRDDRLQLAVDLPAIRGNVGSATLAGELKLRTNDGEQWTLQQLLLEAGPNRVQASGRFGTRNQLRLDVAAADLGQLHSELGGALHGHATLDGELPNPTIRGNLRGEQLRHADTTVARADLSFALPRLALDSSRVDANLAAVVIAGQPAFDATLASSGTRAQQRSSLAVQQQDNRIGVDCTTRSSQPWTGWRIDCPALHAKVHAGHYRDEWRNDKALRGSWKGDAQRFELAPFCLGASDGALCLATPLRVEQGQLRALSVRGRNLPVSWIGRWLPDNLRLDPAARATLQADLKSVAPLQAQASIHIPQTRWSWYLGSERERAEIDDIALELQLDERVAQFRAAATSPVIGSVAAHLDIRDPRGARTLDGNLELRQIELAGLSWMIDGLDALSGRIDGAVRIAGTAAQPLLHGKLLLADGMANWPPLGAPFRSVHMDLEFDNSTARLGGWFALGEGGGDIEGSASWSGAGDDWRVHASLVAGGISAAPLPQSSIVLSPHIDLDATPAEVRVKGFIDIASAEIFLKELPPETIDVSQDARIVGEQRDESALKLWADINLNLGDHFHFQGLGADVTLAGRLRLQQQPGDLPDLTGEVTIPKGRYRAWGQRLSVRRGSFIFYGPWDNPDLNLEAVRELPPTVTDVVGMRVIGSLKTPEAILFSEPSMPDSDIARYLLTGRKPTAGGNGQFSASGALLSLGLAGSEGQASKLAEKFGITDLQLGTTQSATGGDEAELSGQLSQNLYVRYGRGLGEGDNSITFQYRLTPQLMIETISGIENALDVLYSFSVK